VSRGAVAARDFYDLADSIETRALGLGSEAAWESGVCKPWSTSKRPKQTINWTTKWFLWMFLAGRGWGKSWSVMGNSVERWKTGAWKRTALVAPTQDDVRKLVEEDDESGLLAMCYAEGVEARFRPGKLMVEIGAGRDSAKVFLYSAERPGRLRNKQHDSAILDEMREFVGLEAVYDNLIRGLRLGSDPRIIAGTTPPGVVGAKSTGAKVQAANREFIRGVLRGGKYCRREHGQPPPLMSRESTMIVTGPSDENLANISPTYEAQAIEPYRGTRIGKQEVEGLFVDEIEGSILSLEDIEAHRVAKDDKLPDYDVVGVAVDPAGRHKVENSETGILGGARGWPDGFNAKTHEPYGKAHAYILADKSGHYKPLGWARRCCGLYNRLGADWMVGEINHGGDMVEQNIRSYDDSVTFRMVTASRGKHVRIAPCLSLVEQGRVHHVGTTDAAKAAFEVLEDQLTQFTDDGWQGTGSPDHADAWAYLVSELLLGDLRTGYALTF